jgi:hypothetical protein
MFENISKELRARKLITPRRPYGRPDEPYLGQGLAVGR